ncbi:response regulator [Acanthopleuribacter pedis]|uniref:Two-component system response regulator n=1 Tax=Acanthopleuribacter pedis TaxID=442870 RepID=A0A8J7QJU8_9BACT|nr:two-component system response regulator [Acanthopleuribacter pedis]MBO1319553.1 two-component system response regulator [Acanthopleuribacter pedis]
MVGENRKTILVVDDAPENIDVLSGILSDTFKVKAALNGERALVIAAKEPKPVLILLDIMMPGMDGYAVCRRLKQNPATADIPVIFVTAKNQDEDEQQGLRLGAVDYLTKPIRPAIVLARIRTHLALYDQNLALAQKVRERTAELSETRLQIIQRLGRAAEYKDNETGPHVIRMSHYSRLIAEALSDNRDWADLIFNAAPMHDIGKIGIPDRILLKPGKLDAEEWRIMKQHPEFGAEIIGDHPSDIIKTSREIALGHHEKWDGSGYPRGLKGEAIPLSARIIAVADVFDALTTARPYKKAWSVEETLNYMNQGSGRHFDPKLLAVFHQVLDKVLKIKARYAEHQPES